MSTHLLSPNNIKYKFVTCTLFLKKPKTSILNEVHLLLAGVFSSRFRVRSNCQAQGQIFNYIK